MLTFARIPIFLASRGSTCLLVMHLPSSLPVRQAREVGPDALGQRHLHALLLCPSVVAVPDGSLAEIPVVLAAVPTLRHEPEQRRPERQHLPQSCAPTEPASHERRLRRNGTYSRPA